MVDPAPTHKEDLPGAGLAGEVRTEAEGNVSYSDTDNIPCTGHEFQPYFGDSADVLARGGYTPVPVEPNSKAVRLQCWTSLSREDLVALAGQYPHHGIGIRLGDGIAVLDVDTTDDEITDRLWTLAGTFIGGPVRIGKKGFGVVFRLGAADAAELGSGEDWEFEPDQRVQILGQGRQLVAFGIHPDTRKPYSWHFGSPLTTPVSELPLLKLDTLRLMLGSVAGARRVQPKSGTGFRLPERLTKGNTHNPLVSMAAQLAAAHYNDPQAIFEILQRELQERREPPFPPESEVWAIAEWAAALGSTVATELDAAEDFGRVFGGDHKFGRGVWWNWTGQRFAMDDDGAVDRAVKTYVRALEHKAQAIPDDAFRGKMVALARSFQTAGKVSSIEKLAASELTCVVKPSAFDGDGMVLNVANGLVDLRTGALRPTTRADLVTKMAPVMFDPAATCPTWERFLDETFSGERVLINWIQRAVGYSLTGSVVEQVLFILWGVGRNGKSVFLEVIKALLGEKEYALTAAPSVLLERKGDSIPNDLAALAGARFVTASETERNQKFAASRIKGLTGDEAITARFLKREFFSFQPQLKLWLATNGLPQFDGADFAMIRRLRVVKFNNVVPEDKVDRRLKEKLLAELPGILNWCLKGCQEWQSIGLAPPASILETVNDYAAKMDTTGQFLDERCVITGAQSDKVRRSEVWSAYQCWCSENGIRNAITQQQWTEDVEKHRVVFKPKTNGHPTFIGLKMRGSDRGEREV